jgi:hypothetical protein
MLNHKGSSATLVVVAILALATTVASADTVTIATFADPAASSATPLFFLDGTTFTGGWTALGLTLETPVTHQTWPNAKFTMTALSATGGPNLYAVTGGEINFTDSSNNPLLKITFDGGQIFRPYVFGASDVALDNVVFSGPIIGAPVHDEQFAFSFTNEVRTATGYTWTASFTSSAIPEPATLSGLLLAGLTALRRRS